MIDKIFFSAGEVVVLKQDLMFKPDMIVKEMKFSKFKDDHGKKQLLGVQCYWFTNQGVYQEVLFNTKDLVKVERKGE